MPKYFNFFGTSIIRIVFFISFSKYSLPVYGNIIEFLYIGLISV